ncbi:zinc-ribbon domain-containing protein [Methanoregula sp.]|uniref:zinc-ribbon domain-containing protein n=1 Tax=Methanoregula sp. TaxID=2052170 RepID=UPI00356ADB59
MHRSIPPTCPQECPSCHTEVSQKTKICPGCGYDLKPVPYEWAPGAYAYPDYPEFRGCR